MSHFLLLLLHPRQIRNAGAPGHQPSLKLRLSKRTPARNYNPAPFLAKEPGLVAGWLRQVTLTAHTRWPLGTLLLKMRKLLLIIFQICLLIDFAKGQSDSNERFSADSINSIYIPKNLDDCFKQLDTFWTDSIKESIKALSNQEFSTQAHFGFGRWMRNNWQLWGGSRLSKYFNELGIFNPDDMSGIILDSYYRYLTKKDIRLDEQIQSYKDYWTKVKLEKDEQNIEFNRFNIGDTVNYNYLLGFSSRKQKTAYLDGKCVAKGIVIEKNDDLLQLKIRLINSCGRKGIISMDSKQIAYYKPSGDLKEKEPTRKYLRTGENYWFHYLNWQLIKK